VSSFGATTLSVSLEAAFAKELFMEGFPVWMFRGFLGEVFSKTFCPNSADNNL
jgi:hypothetical protein